MNLVLEPDSAMVDDSEVQNQTGVGQRRITWTDPAGLVVGRSARWWRQHWWPGSSRFGAALPVALGRAPGWTVCGTGVDIGCLALLWLFTRREALLGATFSARSLASGSRLVDG